MPSVIDWLAKTKQEKHEIHEGSTPLITPLLNKFSFQTPAKIAVRRLKADLKKS